MGPSGTQLLLSRSVQLSLQEGILPLAFSQYSKRKKTSNWQSQTVQGICVCGVFLSWVLVAEWGVEETKREGPFQVEIVQAGVAEISICHVLCGRCLGG